MLPIQVYPADLDLTRSLGLPRSGEKIPTMSTKHKLSIIKSRNARLHLLAQFPVFIQVQILK